MIFLLSSLCWALDCGIDKELVTAGTRKDGFQIILDDDFTQIHPVWSDDVLRMMLWVEGAESELLSVRWESDRQGLLQEYQESMFTQLWFSNLTMGTHQITATVRSRDGETCQRSVVIKVDDPPLHCSFVDPFVEGDESEMDSHSSVTICGIRPV